MRERVYLVCQIIRIGQMELKDIENHQRVKSSYYIKKVPENAANLLIRRPFGIAAMDITNVLNGKLDCDEDKQYFVPFLQCNERDYLDSVVKKIITSKGGEVSQKDHRGQV